MAVVAGYNTGVVLTDDLAKKLDLPRNNASKSPIRRYKDQIHQVLKLQGLQHIDTTVFKSLDKFFSHSDKFRDNVFIIKPINSAGSKGVRFTDSCQSLAETIKASA